MAERVGVKLVVEDDARFKEKMGSAGRSVGDVGDRAELAAMQFGTLKEKSADLEGQLDDTGDEAETAGDKIKRMGDKSEESKKKTSGLMKMLESHGGTIAKFGGLGSLLVAALPAVLSMTAALAGMAGALVVAGAALGVMALGLAGVVGIGAAAIHFAGQPGHQGAAYRAQHPIGAEFADLGKQLHAILVPIIRTAVPIIAETIHAITPPLLMLAHLFGRYVAPLLRAVQPIVVGTLRGLGLFARSLMPFLLILVQRALPFLRAMGQFFLRVAQFALPLLGNFLTHLFSIVQGLLPTLDRLVKTFLPGAFKLLEVILQAFKPLLKAITDLGKAGIGPLIGLVKLVVTVFSKMLEVLAPAAIATLPAFMKALKILVPLFIPLAKDVGKLAKAFAPLLPVLAKLLVEILRPLLPPLTRFLKQVAHLAIILLPILVPLIGHMARNAASMVDALARLLKWINDHVLGPVSHAVTGPPLTETQKQYDLLHRHYGNAFSWFWTNAVNGLSEALHGTTGPGAHHALFGHHQFGGMAMAGVPTWVGERGPELFVPGSDGTVIPNNRLGGGPNVYLTINTRTDNPRELARLVSQGVSDILARQ